MDIPPQTPQHPTLFVGMCYVGNTSIDCKNLRCWLLIAGRANEYRLETAFLDAAEYHVFRMHAMTDKILSKSPISRLPTVSMIPVASIQRAFHMYIVLSKVVHACGGLSTNLLADGLLIIFGSDGSPPLGDDKKVSWPSRSECEAPRSEPHLFRFPHQILQRVPCSSRGMHNVQRRSSKPFQFPLLRRWEALHYGSCKSGLCLIW